MDTSDWKNHVKREKVLKREHMDDHGDAEQETRDLISENERLKMAKSTNDKTSKKLEKVLESDKTTVDASSTQVKGLKLQVKTENASLQEEVVNVKKIKIDLEAADHEYDVKDVDDIAATKEVLDELIEVSRTLGEIIRVNTLRMKIIEALIKSIEAKGEDDDEDVSSGADTEDDDDTKADDNTDDDNSDEDDNSTVDSE